MGVSAPTNEVVLAAEGPSGVGKELLTASGAAEAIGDSLVLGLVDRSLELDRHLADRIDGGRCSARSVAERDRNWSPHGSQARTSDERLSRIDEELLTAFGSTEGIGDPFVLGQVGCSLEDDGHPADGVDHLAGHRVAQGGSGGLRCEVAIRISHKAFSAPISAEVVGDPWTAVAGASVVRTCIPQTGSMA